ncbi:hypothetical protein PsWM33_03575 [Pseudovibrio sp. WM33]|nr:hypothetical protein PsWM33_03575 [Pseudovibrio sp. WM33]
MAWKNPSVATAYQRFPSLLSRRNTCRYVLCIEIYEISLEITYLHFCIDVTLKNNELNTFVSAFAGECGGSLEEFGVPVGNGCFFDGCL